MRKAAAAIGNQGMCRGLAPRAPLLQGQVSIYRWHTYDCMEPDARLVGLILG